MGTEHKLLTDTEKLQRRNRELSILNAIAEALNREVDLPLALRTSLAQVTELLDLETGWIWLLDEETGKTYLAAAQNLPPGLADHPQRMSGTCHCLDTYEAGDMDGAANINVITCSRLKWLADGTGGLRYHASIPLYAHDKKVGLMNVASTDWRELSPADLRLLHTVGDLLGIAIERARLFARSAEIGAARERNRLAREIHDTLAQGLAAIALQLETVDALLEGGVEAERTRKVVQQALDTTRASLEEARRSVLDLRAAPLEGRTLGDALCMIAEDYADRWDVEISLEVIGEDRPLSARIESGLYRIAQEALANAAHHASAGAIKVSLTLSPDEIALVVEDDGVGFDPDLISEGRFGLIGLNERARLLGGTFEICSSPGDGTRIEVTAPLEQS